YDAPLGMEERLAALAPKAELLCGAPAQGDADELARVLRVDRTALGELYKALCRTAGSFYNRAGMLDALRREASADERAARFAIGVFEELGFVSVTDAGARLVKDAPGRSLEESRAFAAANAILDDHQHYLRCYKEA
ncbi:MAG TPA: single-stranded-DNA-specific exonuclease C-terminal domain-containing protein, partial [Clostridia bacterium]|nr:single-stranded-DNA-specific exonuclease C-terminal domain-containing protein [Clostridia bacterium]